MTDSPYAVLIRPAIPEGMDPRHVEAYMRLQFGTLDHLESGRFAREAELAAEAVTLGGAEEAEALAASMGL